LVSGSRTLRLRKFGVWHWRVPHNARGGKWSATVICRKGRHVSRRGAHLLGAVAPQKRPAIVAPGPFVAPLKEFSPGPPGGARRAKGGGGYPDDAALCEWTDKRDGACTDYDWGYAQKNGRWSLISNRGFNYRNCTDFVAWYMGLTWSSFEFPPGK